MEFKHFSHIHGLVFHQTAQGSEIHCSGCKSSGGGNVYACWKCNYLLHEHCFRATRSLNHPSHSLHPLTLLPYPTYPSTQFFCNSCSLVGNGFCYCCSECEFDVHVHCAHLAASVPLPNFNHQNHHVYPPLQNNPFPNYVPSSS
ncbi:hypothetical protein ACS0TY_003323 [Phlomoides rotata]